MANVIKFEMKKMSGQKTKKKAGTATKPTQPVTQKANPKPNTVNGKRALYQQTAVNFQQAANEMVTSGINNLQAGIGDMQKSIHKTAANFQRAANEMHAEGISNLQSGVAEMVSGIAAMQASIANQVKEHQEYTKQFYG